MATTPAAQFVSVETYLDDPRYEKAEYVEGQIVEREMGNPPHADAQGNCFAELRAFCRASGLGRAYTEMRCQIQNQPPIFRQPDVCVVLGQRVKHERFLDRAPDLAVEVRSPRDTVSSLMRKAEQYLAAGSRQVWLIFPEEESVLILNAGEPPITRTAEETIEGGALLPGFSIAVRDLFQ